MTDNDLTREEWAADRNTTQEALKWAEACDLQIERCRDAFRRGQLSFPPDWTALSQAQVGGHFLAVAAGQLRGALLLTSH